MLIENMSLGVFDRDFRQNGAEAIIWNGFNEF
jgi:hypothetical protein